MALQNSIYAPTPLSTSDGGTGNNLPLYSGQVWGGTSLGFTAVKNLVAGTNIAIEDTPTDITIGATGGFGALTWKLSTGEDLAPNTGYIISTPSDFNWTSNGSVGDIYIIKSYNDSDFGFTVHSTTHNIYYIGAGGGGSNALGCGLGNQTLGLVCLPDGNLGVLFTVGEFFVS